MGEFTGPGPSKAFFRMVVISFVVLQLVILAGALVRVSGSGMGCPDWPFCFGLIIPPVSLDQLPPDYATTFAVEGRPAVFNPWNTWIEFINRLVGVLAGFCLLIQTVWAFRYRKINKGIFTLSLGVLLLTMAEGALGARVVSSYLKPAIVTLHYGLAVIILILQTRLLFKLSKSRRSEVENTPWLVKPWIQRGLWLLIPLTIFQVLLGTRVREEWESLIWGHELDHISLWGGLTSSVMDLHRFWSFLMGFLTIIISIGLLRSQKTREKPPSQGQKILPLTLMAMVILQVVVGFLMTSFNQDWGKPVHLMGANTMILVEFLILWSVSSLKKQ